MKKYLFAAGILLSFVTNGQKIKLFIDCSQAGCDYDYIRKEIPVVDYVRDRQEADIHVMIIFQPAGNGGRQYSILFFHRLQPTPDTLRFITPATSTEDNTRRALVKIIKAGIAPSLAANGINDRMNISFSTDTSSSVNKTKDKWDNWTFSIEGRGRFSGDRNYKERSISANINASRITEKSKLKFHIYNSNTNNSYSIDNSGIKGWLRTSNRYQEFEQEYVKSISGKWSWAFQSAYSKSSYDNIKGSYSAAAGIEYNIFPYSASGSKFLVFRWMMEATERKYFEETVFDKKRETLFSNNLGAFIYFTQPWGSISSGIYWYNYLHDLSKNNLSLDANMEIQLIKGVSINFFGTASLINDQLNLVKSGASEQEVLLRLKALSTNFNYYTGIGIRYRFGSKFNNHVNPRFTNGRY